MRRKSKNSGPGERCSVWVPERYRQLWKEIENKSGFIQLCLDNAVDIMAWDILKKTQPEIYKGRPEKVEEVLPAYNELHPPDALTAKRLGKNVPRTERADSPSHQETNPALL